MGSGFLLVLVAMFAVMYFLLIRPQRQQQRRHTAMLSSLKPGDEVITSGGIYGEVTEVDTERVMLEIDDDVRIAVARRAVASIVPPEELERLEGDETHEALAEPAAGEESEAARPVEEDVARR